MATTRAAMISQFRELTGEKDTTVVPDTTVDVYVTLGLEATNRRTDYVDKTDTSLVLTAGVQEYLAPRDLVRIRYLTWNGNELRKASVDEWQRAGLNWRSEDPGPPQEYALLGLNLLLRPPPSPAAVAITTSLPIRYVASPPDFTANGPSGLGDQSTTPAVLYAVQLWRAAHPDSDMAPQSAEQFLKSFDAETALLAREYQERGLEA